jgi:hypothetical protein
VSSLFKLVVLILFPFKELLESFVLGLRNDDLVGLSGGASRIPEPSYSPGDFAYVPLVWWPLVCGGGSIAASA